MCEEEAGPGRRGGLDAAALRTVSILTRVMGQVKQKRVLTGGNSCATLSRVLVRTNGPNGGKSKAMNKFRGLF